MAEDDLASIALVYQGGDIRAKCSFGFRSISGDPDWRQFLVDEFYVTVCAQFLNGLVETVELKSLECIDELPGTGATVFAAITGIQNGSWSLPMASPQIAGLLKWSGPTSHRSTKGRNYVQGLPREQMNLDGSVWDAEAQDSLEDIGEVMNETYGPSGSSPWARFGIISRRRDGVPQVPIVWYPVIHFEFSPVVATIRRRLLR